MCSPGQPAHGQVSQRARSSQRHHPGPLPLTAIRPLRAHLPPSAHAAACIGDSDDVFVMSGCRSRRRTVAHRHASLWLSRASALAVRTSSSPTCERARAAAPPTGAHQCHGHSDMSVDVWLPPAPPGPCPPPCARVHLLAAGRGRDDHGRRKEVVAPWLQRQQRHRRATSEATGADSLTGSVHRPCRSGHHLVSTSAHSPASWEPPPQTQALCLLLLPGPGTAMQRLHFGTFSLLLPRHQQAHPIASVSRSSMINATVHMISAGSFPTAAPCPCSTLGHPNTASTTPGSCRQVAFGCHRSTKSTPRLPEGCQARPCCAPAEGRRRLDHVVPQAGTCSSSSPTSSNVNVQQRAHVHRHHVSEPYLLAHHQARLAVPPAPRRPAVHHQAPPQISHYHAARK